MEYKIIRIQGDGIQEDGQYGRGDKNYIKEVNKAMKNGWILYGNYWKTKDGKHCHEMTRVEKNNKG